MATEQQAQKKKNSGHGAVSHKTENAEPLTYSHKMSVRDLDADETSVYGTAESEESYPTFKQRKKGQSNAIVDIMHERTRMMDTMTKSVAAISQGAVSKPPEDNCDMLWAKSLVLLMARMKQEIKDQFMVFTYQTAMDGINGKMPGPK